MREIGQRMRRALGDALSLQPGEYCVTEHETMAGFVRSVHVRCPDCGGVDTLGDRYNVLPHSGLVTPRWTCPTETCGYRQRLTLESWS